MKILDKVKTIFWDNEDEDEEEIEESTKIQNKKKIKEEQNEVINERDLFKTETSFKFPVVFTEEDFAKTIPPEKTVNSKTRFEYNNKVEQNIKAKDSKNEDVNVNKKKEVVKTFKLSPAISPVYGVLDKNYKKEDIKTKETHMSRKKENEISFENIRRKAYGTLSDEIEKTMVDNKELKQEIEEKVNPNKDITIEEAIGNYEDLGMVYSTDKNTEEDIIKLKKDKKAILEDTIEQDLFNLIDSMYDKEEKEGDESNGTSE